MLVVKVEDLFAPLSGGKTKEETPLLGILELEKVLENIQVENSEPEPEQRQVGPKRREREQARPEMQQLQPEQKFFFARQRLADGTPREVGRFQKRLQ
jgi:hypothetical protein